MEVASENFDVTSQSGSISVDDENSDITFENGTEDTEDYEDDIGSASCEPIDEDKQSVHSVSSGGIITSTTIATTTATATGTGAGGTAVTAPIARYTSASGAAGIARASSTSAATPTSMAATKTANENQSLQKVAAAAWNYQTTAKEVGIDNGYLNDIYFEEEEKVYEDLCYVTFSSKLPEVCINKLIL